jgi:UDP-galactopyranose mutase
MAKACDVLIIGAGPVGCVTARKLAEKGLHCLVLEQRRHLAGNCFDETDSFGVLVHRYGPHYFRTNKEELLQWLGKFSDFVPGNYVVKSQIGPQLYPFPINLDTLEKFFGKKLDEKSGQELLESLQVKLPHSPKNSEEFVLSRVGEKLYENFYLGYTLKQWETHPKDLAPSVCGRIPVRLNRFDRYVDHKYQVMPKNGFTQMFKNMLTHPNIEVVLNVNYLENRKSFSPAKATLYTGPIDAYFDYQEGSLPWRSLEFDFRNFEKDYVQPCVQINYPELNVPYTRSVEIKHATGQILPSTTVCYEYPKAKGDPFYPVPSPKHQELYLKYKDLAQKETISRSVFFAGRLAEYTYINTDEAIEKGLEAADLIWNQIHAKNT